jgi:GDP/UDP-N,N'-diacetylbacillosamine 2-epimerase (hydrolysing)
VIQLGENPSFVYNVGALAMDNIFSEEFYSKEDVFLKLGLNEDTDYAIVTYHPETLGENAIKDIKVLLDFCASYSRLNFIFTKANADQLGIYINEEISKATLKSKHIKLFDSLGSKLYLSALKYSKFVMGNSSSGILEAPFLNVRTINIGNRQKGRIQTSSIINVDMSKSQLFETVEEILRSNENPIIANNIYRNGDTSVRIKTILKNELNKGISIKKEFFDL